MRKRQIERPIADSAMRWKFCWRLGEERPIAMLGRRGLYRLRNWLEAQERQGGRNASVERPGSFGSLA
jgi:hypothetical protein